MKDNELLIQISKILHRLGISPKIMGFRYIRDAIFLCYKDETNLNKLTRNLYPKIADMNDTTIIRVEKNIRHAIEISWGKGDIDFIEEIFGYKTSKETSRPTNGDFIALLTEYLKLVSLDRILR